MISNKLEDHLEDPYDIELVKKYNPMNIKTLHAAANYLGIKSLVHLCFIRIGTEIFINTNTNGSIKAIKQKFGVEGDYTIQVELDLKKKYPFMMINQNA